jgi:two-component system OmpR family sensor kinase
VRFLARIPIRLRLTLLFALAMAAVLAGMALFVYLRVDSELDRAADRSLRARADDVVTLVRQAGSGLGATGGDSLTEQEESFAQVLEADGTVVDSTPLLGDRPLLTEEELARAARETTLLDRESLPGADDPVRLLATPLDADGRRLVVVVGESIEAREEALDSLLTQLFIIGPLVLVLSSLGAYGLAAAALRPVESMRREAETVSAAEPGRRLPIPPARDEIADLGKTLNEMLARLEAALARERRFVSDASHELRTPLAALRTELDLALRRERTRQELEAALRSAAEETERLSQLAEDLLVLARSDAGTLPVRRERVAAADLLAGVSERYARRAAEAGRPLEIEADGGLELSADRLRLEQALGNLVENALRHGAGRILLRAQREDGRVELHVRDEGGGFADDFIAHAFDPFSRDDPGRTSPGAGLGLAIVDVIARAHGGSAHAANRNGGADVWLELPSRAD